MKYKINVLIVFFFCSFTYAQTDYQKDINVLRLQIDSIKKEHELLKKQTLLLRKEINNKIEKSDGKFYKKIDSVNYSIKQESNTLDSKIKLSKDSTANQISELDNSISKNTLYWLIGVLLLSLGGLFIYIVLSKKVSDQSVTLSEKILKTKSELESEVIKLDSKTIEVIESQLQLLKNTAIVTLNNREEMDHSLALKVADEIVRIQKNILQMDPNTRGIKQLSSAVLRIKDNFEANGYEIVDMLNKPYNEGVHASVTIIHDDKLQPNEKIISRIIKPQINYKGQMIQSAQIEVNQGA